MLTGEPKDPKIEEELKKIMIGLGLTPTPTLDPKLIAPMEIPQTANGKDKKVPLSELIPVEENDKRIIAALEPYFPDIHDPEVQQRFKDGGMPLKISMVKFCYSLVQKIESVQRNILQQRKLGNFNTDNLWDKTSKREFEILTDKNLRLNTAKGFIDFYDKYIIPQAKELLISKYLSAPLTDKCRYDIPKFAQEELSRSDSSYPIPYELHKLRSVAALISPTHQETTTCIVNDDVNPGKTANTTGGPFNISKIIDCYNTIFSNSAEKSNLLQNETLKIFSETFKDSAIMHNDESLAQISNLIKEKPYEMYALSLFGQHVGTKISDMEDLNKKLELPEVKHLADTVKISTIEELTHNKSARMFYELYLPQLKGKVNNLTQNLSPTHTSPIKSQERA